MLERIVPALAASAFLVALGVPVTAQATPAVDDGPDVPEDLATLQEAPDTTMVELASKNDSGVRARARVVHTAQQVQVAISAVGVEAGEEYPTHIHLGTCENGGGVAAALDPVAMPAEDAEAGTTTSSVAMEVLEEAKEESEAEDPGFFLQIHLPDGTPAACGDLGSDEPTDEG